jgi:hypothetical protein
MKLSGIFVVGLLVLIIASSLTCSCMGLKEGFEAATSWKSSGQTNWGGPYNVENQQPVPSDMLIFSNNVSSPECCKQASSFSTSDGCICVTQEQLNFLNQRGGNRTVEDGF